MKRVAFLTLAISLCILSGSVHSQCTAGFSVNPPTVAYLPTYFTDQSTTPPGEVVTYSWAYTSQFGAAGSSSLQNPMHTFYGGASSNNDACLTISSATCLDTFCMQIGFPNLSQPLPAQVQLFKASRQSNTITFNAGMDDGHGFYYTNWFHVSSGPPYAFDWDFGDGSFLNATSMGNVSHQYINPGVYTVTLNGRGANYDYTFSGTYSDTVHINAIPTSIVEQSIENIQIYPNMIKDFITIDLSSIREKVFEFKITDLQGRVILKTAQLVGGNVEQIDLSGLESQLYIITLQSEDKIVTKKVVKL